MSSVLRAATVVAILGSASFGLVGCAGVDGDETDTVESPLSSTRSRVVPLGDASRASCREVAAKVFCSEAEAQQAAARCAPPGAASSVAVVSSSGACAATGLAYPTLSSCATPQELDCSFYSACVDRAIPCGSAGYSLGFGEKYCTAFRAANLSPAGKKWVGRTMACLQRALVPEIRKAEAFASAPASEARCKEVFDTAFASHPACYTGKESSICFLPPGDIFTVLDTIGVREILTRRTSSQMLVTAGICVGQLTKRLFTAGKAGPAEARANEGVGVARRVGGDDEALEERALGEEPTREDLEAMLVEWQKIEAQERR